MLPAGGSCGITAAGAGHLQHLGIEGALQLVRRDSSHAAIDEAGAEASLQRVPMCIDIIKNLHAGEPQFDEMIAEAAAILLVYVKLRLGAPSHHDRYE